MIAPEQLQAQVLNLQPTNSAAGAMDSVFGKLDSLTDAVISKVPDALDALIEKEIGGKKSSSGSGYKPATAAGKTSGDAYLNDAQSQQKGVKEYIPYIIAGVLGLGAVFVMLRGRK